MEKTLKTNGFFNFIRLLGFTAIFIIVGFNAPLTAQTKQTDNLKVIESYKRALKNYSVRQNSQAEILMQIKAQKPLAFIDGYWIITFDYGKVYENEIVKRAIEDDLKKIESVKNPVKIISPDHTEATQGVLFVPHNYNILKELGLDILAGAFPDLGMHVDLGGIMGAWCWGDDTDPWPDDEEPWPPEEDDDEEDPWDRDPWPDDEEPWPPEEDDLMNAFFVFSTDIACSLTQEIEHLFYQVSDTAKSEQFLPLVGSGKQTSEIQLILP